MTSYKSYLNPATHGNSEAQYNLAMCYYQGTGGTKKNHLEAFEWFSSSALKNHSKSLYQLGIMYKNGENIEKDSKKSLELFQKSEEPESFFEIGLYYLNEEKNEKQALEYFLKASGMDNKESHFQLAKFHMQGKIIEKNEKKAFDLFQKSKTKESFYFLGRFYLEGILVEIDEKVAFEYFLKSAKENHTESQFEVGNCYKQGIGVELNENESLKWLKKSASKGHAESSFLVALETEDEDEKSKYYEISANKGHIEAQYCLAMYLEDENPQESMRWMLEAALNNHSGALFQCGLQYEINEEFEQAFEFFMKSAQQDNVDAIPIVASYFENGVLAPVDVSTAIKWYKKGVEMGSKESQYKLGKIYLIQGKYYEAFQLFKDSDDYPPSQYELSQCYLRGIGIKMDKILSQKWLIQAAKNDFIDAQRFLGECFGSGECNIKKNDGESFKWYMKAAKQNDAWSQFQIGGFYESGKGTEKNLLKAFHWYSKSNTTLAIYKTGTFLQEGIGVKKNSYQAYQTLKLNQESDHIPSLVSLAILCDELGKLEKSFSLFEKSSALGDSFSAYQLAICYEYGKGVDLDELKAFELYLSLEKLNYPASFYKLGTFYEDGIAVNVDDEIAFNYYLNGSTLNHIDSIKKVALFYEIGIHVKENKNEAFKYYLRAAKLGDLDSKYFVGLHYKSMKNLKDAFSWFQSAGTRGHAESQYHCGMILKEKELKNPKEMLDWFKRANERGSFDAFYELSIHGRDIKKMMIILPQLKNLMVRGDLDGQKKYSEVCYLLGETGMDLDTKIFYYTESAKCGHAGSAYNLHLNYISDENQSIYWLERSAILNYNYLGINARLFYAKELEKKNRTFESIQWVLSLKSSDSDLFQNIDKILGNYQREAFPFHFTSGFRFSMVMTKNRTKKLQDIKFRF
jgi:TPR repeat protein